MASPQKETDVSISVGTSRTRPRGCDCERSGRQRQRSCTPGASHQSLSSSALAGRRAHTRVCSLTRRTVVSVFSCWLCCYIRAMSAKQDLGFNLCRHGCRNCGRGEGGGGGGQVNSAVAVANSGRVVTYCSHIHLQLLLQAASPSLALGQALARAVHCLRSGTCDLVR